jgi:hypothetical protein
MYKLVYDNERLINDKNFAKESGFKVFSFKSKNLKALERNLKEIKSEDENWKDKVTNLKRLISKEKETNDRYIIRYNKNMINSENISNYGLYRSVITDGKKIFAFSPPKSISYDTIKEESYENDVECLEYVEGTMINMYHDNKWKIATRSNIGADIKFNLDIDMTFRDMFLEAFSSKGLEFDMFSKEYSYSFVLQHPKNRIVVPFNKTNLILTNIYDCQNGEMGEIREIDMKNGEIPWIKNEYRHLIEFPRDMKDVLNNEDITLKEIEDAVYGGLDYTIQGAVFVNKRLMLRSKIRNQNYENVRILKGNSPKLQYQYYNLRKYGKVREFLMYYPEYKEKFAILRQQVHIWTHTLWGNYINCYVNKEKPLREFPFEYRTHMFNLHKLYIDELRSEQKFVNRKVVINYINNLEPDHLMSSINYPLKCADLKENEIKLNDALS